MALCLLQESIPTPEPADISEDDHYSSEQNLSLSISPGVDLAVPFLAGVGGGRTFTYPQRLRDRSPYETRQRRISAGARACSSEARLHQHSRTCDSPSLPRWKRLSSSFFCLSPRGQIVRRFGNLTRIVRQRCARFYIIEPCPE